LSPFTLVRLLHLILRVPVARRLETLSRTAAFADNLDFLGVASSVVTDELQATFLGATRSAAIGTAITAANGIPDRLGGAASVFHVIVAILFFPASGGCGNIARRQSTY
jgi:hypothetical protein